MMRDLLHLAWKDMCLGGALVVIAAAIMAAVSIGVMGADLNREHVEQWTAANYWTWFAAIVVPFIAAAGLPAQLVGNETESGTLDWLRGFPVSAPRIMASKVAVAVGMLLAVWLVSWGLLLRRSEFLESYFLFSSFNALQVALTAFIFVLLARNTLVSLLLVVPVSATATVALGRLTVWIEELPPYYSPDINSPVQIGLLSVYCALLLVILFAIVIPLRFAPRRARWSMATGSPSESATFWRSAEPVSVGPGVGGRRFGMLGVLLWQQVRQSWTVYVSALVLLGVAAVAIMLEIAGRANAGPVPYMVGLVILSVLGSQSFAGDSGKSYQIFLATRGIRPSLAWATRVLPGLAVATLALALVAVIVSSQRGREAIITVYGGFFVFAVAQLWAMWFQRPIVAHFAAVAFGGFLLMVLSSGILFLYPAFGWILGLAAFGFVATTFSAASWWLDGRRTRGFHLAMSVGLTASIVIACGIGLAVRLLDRPWGVQSSSLTPIEVSLNAPSDDLPDVLQRFDSLLRESDISTAPAARAPELVQQERAELIPLLDDLLQLEPAAFAPLVPSHHEALHDLTVLNALALDRQYTEYGWRSTNTVEDFDGAIPLMSLVLKMAQAVRYNPDLPSHQLADQYEELALSYLQRKAWAGELTPQEQQWIRRSLIDAEQRTALRQRALVRWLPQARRSVLRQDLNDSSLLWMTNDQRVRIASIPGEASRALAWLEAIAAHHDWGDAWGQFFGYRGAGIARSRHYYGETWLPWTSRPGQLTKDIRRALRRAE